MTTLNGPTKFFFEDPTIDHLLAMVMSLGAELAAVRDELETLKDVAIERGLMGREELATYVPPPLAQAERDRARERMVANVLFPLEQACDALIGEKP